MLRNLALALTLALALPALVAAFSGAGKEEWIEAQKFLGANIRMSVDEAATIRALSPQERLDRAIPHLLEAERQATGQDAEAVARLLGRSYNDLALMQADQKDYRNAAYGMAEAIKRLPQDAVLQWNLGNFQYAAGDYFESARSLAKARDQGDSQMRAKAGRALVQSYMKQAQSSDARAYDYAIKELEAMTFEHPDDAELLYLLGENHRLKGDGAQALAVWEKARALGAFPAGAEQRYQQLKSATAIKADNQFATDASVHFKIEFEDKAKGADLARKFLDMFESAYDELGLKFGLQIDHTVHVTVYTDAQFVSATKVAWAGGMHAENKVDLRVSPRASDSEYRNTIFHEYTHHLISCKASQKHVPQWLNEGLAMHHEPVPETRAMEDLMTAVLRKRKTYLPFSQISESFAALPSELHVRIAYAQAFSITAALIERFGFDAVLNILKVLGTGQDFDETFRNVTRVSFSDFEKQWFEARMAAIDDPPPASGTGAGAPRPPTAPPPPTSPTPTPDAALSPAPKAAPRAPLRASPGPVPSPSR